jgi:hypothetical protein
MQQRATQVSAGERLETVEDPEALRALVQYELFVPVDMMYAAFGIVGEEAEAMKDRTLETLLSVFGAEE